MTTTTCLACTDKIQDTGGGVFVTVDGDSYECPVGARQGVDHITRDARGRLVTNGDVLPAHVVEALGLNTPTEVVDLDAVTR